MTELYSGALAIVSIPATFIVVSVFLKYVYLFIQDRMGKATNEDKAVLMSAAGDNPMIRAMASRAISNASLSPYECRMAHMLIRKRLIEIKSNGQINSFLRKI